MSDVFGQSTSPAAPTALASTLQTTTSITLSWAAPVTEAGGAAVTGYILYRNDGSADGAVSIEVYGADAAPDATTTTSGLSFEVTGLSGGVEYQFAVAARSSAGLGDRSGLWVCLRHLRWPLRLRRRTRRRLRSRWLGQLRRLARVRLRLGTRCTW